MNISARSTRILISLALLTGWVAILHAETADSIIARLEAKQNPPFMTMSGTMSIKDRFGTRSISYQSWSKGSENLLLEFTSEAEAGQKILRLGKTIHLYYPDAEKTITLRGNALGDAVMGSDMSYEDLTGNRSLRTDYDAVLDGEESLGGFDCWVITLTAKNRDVAFDRQKIWIDKKDYVTRQAWQYSRAGRLVRTMTVTEFSSIGEWIFPRTMVLEDQLKKNTSTTFSLGTIDVKSPIPDGKLSLRDLGR